MLNLIPRRGFLGMLACLIPGAKLCASPAPDLKRALTVVAERIMRDMAEPKPFTTLAFENVFEDLRGPSGKLLDLKWQGMRIVDEHGHEHANSLTMDERQFAAAKQRALAAVATDQVCFDRPTGSAVL